jgi:hypothetical protein
MTPVAPALPTDPSGGLSLGDHHGRTSLLPGAYDVDLLERVS